jgi:hypothetical protein
VDSWPGCDHGVGKPENSARWTSWWRRLQLAGQPGELIAFDLGLYIKQVDALLEERGVKRSRSAAAALAGAHRRATVTQPASEWSAEVLGRYAAGESGATIAESLGLAQSSVYRLLGDRSVLRSHNEASRVRAGNRPRREPAGEPTATKATETLPADLAEQAVARYEAGEPPRVIGVALGVPASRVYRVLKAWGVLRSRSEARTVAHARRREADED